MTALVLHFPFPPPLNNLYVNIPRRGRVKSKRYLTWHRAALNEVLPQVKTPINLRFNGNFIVDIALGRPDKRKRDIDGTAKAILDLLTGIAWADDSQVVDLRMRWADVVGAIVTIQPTDAT